MLEVQEEKEILNRILEDEEKERKERIAYLLAEREKLIKTAIAAAIMIQKNWRGYFVRNKIIKLFKSLRSLEFRSFTVQTLLPPIENLLMAFEQYSKELERVLTL